MNLRKREGSIPVVWRATPSRLLVNNVFGSQSVNAKICKCCGLAKPIDDFYLESSSKAKDPEQVRSHCIVCWDKHKGKTSNSYPPTNTLECFIMENKNAGTLSMGRKVSPKNRRRDHSS